MAEFRVAVRLYGEYTDGSGTNRGEGWWELGDYGAGPGIPIVIRDVQTGKFDEYSLDNRWSFSTKKIREMAFYGTTDRISLVVPTVVEGTRLSGKNGSSRGLSITYVVHASLPFPTKKNIGIFNAETTIHFDEREGFFLDGQLKITHRYYDEGPFDLYLKGYEHSVYGVNGGDVRSLYQAAGIDPIGTRDRDLETPNLRYFDADTVYENAGVEPRFRVELSTDTTSLSTYRWHVGVFGSEGKVGGAGLNQNLLVSLEPGTPLQLFWRQSTSDVNDAVARMKSAGAELPENATGLDSEVQLPPKAFASCFNSVIAEPYLKGIAGIVDGAPLSGMPVLISADNENCVCSYGRALAIPKSTSPATLETVSEQTSVVPRAKPTFQVVFPRFIDHDGKPIEGTATLVADPLKFQQTGRRVFDMGLELSDPEPSAVAQTYRIGALDLKLAAIGLSVPGKEITIQASPRLEPSLKIPVWTSEARLTVKLCVFRAQPAAQDQRPDELRAREIFLGRAGGDPQSLRRVLAPPPLVIPVAPVVSMMTDTRGYILKLEEENGDNVNRSLDLLLLQSGNGQSSQDVLVIDPAPFLVAKVATPPLRVSSSGDDGALVARWRTSEQDGAKWDILADGQAGEYDVDLPPQAVGEEMEKENGKYGDLDGTPLRPLGNDCRPRASDYRFSPPAHLTLRASLVDRRYLEAPWNTRRVLGYAGQRAPGSEVRKIGFELLYGLAGAIEGRAGLMLSEVEAQMGAVPNLVPPRRYGDDNPYSQTPTPVENHKAQHDAYKHWRADWRDDRRNYQRRLSTLAPYDLANRDGASFEGSVTYHLRQTDAVDPVDPKPKQYLNLESGESEPLDPEGHEIGERGFFGGVLWAIESDNELRAVLRNRQSSSGDLRRPGLSARGGFGWLKAAFDRNLTKFYADVELGQARFYSKERIGRIGNLWNHAKHVVVYERTPIRQRQFRDVQPEHDGRMVIRKVQEYVEILQPTRRYPEEGTFTLGTAFLKGSQFRSQRIPVDGDWGGDVADLGYFIPLWRRDADPEVYPRPQVDLILAEAAGADDAELNANILDPEKLAFYTDTRGKTDANTDAWDAIKAIDYGDEAEAVPPYMRPDDIIDGTGGSGRLPDPPPIESFAAFTYRISTGGRAVRLNAGRTGDPLGAVLENVTFMRARPGGTASQRIPSDIHEAIRSVFGEANEGPDKIIRTINNHAEVAAAVQSIGQDLFRAADKSGSIPKDKLDDAERRLKALSTTAAFKRVDEKFKILIAGLEGPLTNPCANLKLGDAAKSVLVAREAEIKAAIDELSRRFMDLAADLVNGPGATVEKVAQRLRADVGVMAARLDIALTPLRLGLGRAINDIAVLRGEIDSETRYFISELRRLDREILDLIAAVNTTDFRPQVESVRSRLPALERRVMDALARTGAALKKHGDGRFTDLVTTVQAALDDLDRETRVALREVDETLKAAATEIGDHETELKGAALQLRENIAQAMDFVAGTGRQIAGLVGDVEAPLASLLTDLRTWPDEATTDLEDLIKAAEGGAAEDLQEFHSILVNGISGATQKTRSFVVGKFSQLESAFNHAIDKICTSVDCEVKKVYGDLAAYLESKLIKELNENLGDVQKAFADWESRFADAAGRITSYVDGIKDSDLYQAKDAAMRLYRGYGSGPILPQLEFNRNRLAYIFDDNREAILTSPVAAIVNDAGQVLNAAGIKLPTQEMLDRLIPHDIAEASLNRVIDWLGGLRFARLFSGLKMPAIARKAITVKHGVDKDRQLAYVYVDMNHMPFGGGEVFSFGPLKLELRGAHMSAHAHVEATLESGTTSRTWGSVSGDWDLSIGGMKLVSFERSQLLFDEDGKFEFDIDPKRIRLDRAIQMISDLLSEVSDPDNGFIVALETDANDRPVGVRATLDLRDISVGAGAVGISNMALGAFLGLKVVEQENSGSNFVISAGMNLGRSAAPFAITIYFLQGGGWLVASSQYTVDNGELSASVSLAISAGAGALFNVGWASGDISVAVAVAVDYHTRGVQAGLSFSVMLILRGRVVVIRIITITLAVILSLTYRRDGTMFGTGRIVATMRISRFFKISVDKSFTYTLREGSGGRARAISGIRRQSILSR